MESDQLGLAREARAALDHAHETAPNWGDRMVHDLGKGSIFRNRVLVIGSFSQRRQIGRSALKTFPHSSHVP